jgi:hypothetical protein
MVIVRVVSEPELHNSVEIQSGGKPPTLLS